MDEGSSETQKDRQEGRRGRSAGATSASSPSLDAERLLALVLFEYRSLVVRRLRVTAEWRVLEWIEYAACAGLDAVGPEVCRHCPVKSECLAAAIATDDPAEWRGGLDRTARDGIWETLEPTYREVRDFDLLGLNLDRLQGGTT